MRRSRDADFGVQVVGRILRVHRLLQCKERSDLLKYGYVVLADYAIQKGLTKAADRLKSIETQLTSASTNIGLVIVGSEEIKAQEMKGGQASFWNAYSKPQVDPEALPGTTDSGTVGAPQQITFFAGDTNPALVEPETVSPIVHISGKIYYLRKDLKFPKVLKKEVCNADMVAGLAKCISSQINLEGDIMNVVFRRFAQAAYSGLIRPLIPTQTGH